MAARSKIIRYAGIAIIVGLFVTISWALVDTGIHATSDYEFCTGCHSHKPIGSSYIEDLHGGNNSVGWRATCSDCHISHDNALSYLWVKAIHGVVDPTMEIIKDPYDIDWHANRERREHYVYDSGCLSCHKYLQRQTKANRKSFLPHQKYFSEKEQGLTCVGCHQNVGHANLGTHLKEQGWEVNNEE